MDLIEFQKWEDEIEKNPEKRDEYKRVKNQWANDAFEYIIHEFDIDPKEIDFKHMTFDIFMKYYKQTKGKLRNDTKRKMETLGSSTCIYEEDFEKYKKILKWDTSYFIENPNISYEFIKKYYIEVDFYKLGPLHNNKHITFENAMEICEYFVKREKLTSIKSINQVLRYYCWNKNLTTNLFMEIMMSNPISHDTISAYLEQNINTIYIPKTCKLYYEYQKDIEKRIIQKEIVEDTESFLSKWDKHSDWKHSIVCNPSFSSEYFLSDQFLSKAKMSKKEFFDDYFCLGNMLEYNIGITLQECKFLKDEHMRLECESDFQLKEYIKYNDLTRDRMNYFYKHASHLF